MHIKKSVSEFYSHKNEVDTTQPCVVSRHVLLKFEWYGHPKNFLIFFPLMFYIKTKRNSLLILQKQKSLKKIQMASPNASDIELCGFINTISPSFVWLWYAALYIYDSDTQWKSSIYRKWSVRKTLGCSSVTSTPTPLHTHKHLT